MVNITSFCGTQEEPGQMIYPPARNLPPISIKGCDGFNSTVRRGIIYPKDASYT